MYDDIIKAETFAETYVAISKMSDEEVDSLLNTLTGPTAQNVPKMVDLPLTPKEVENLRRLKEAGKNMPLTVQGKRQIAQAVEAAKKRKVNQKRTAFQQALNQPKKVENPVNRAKRKKLSETQELPQQPQQQRPPLKPPKKQRTMSNKEMKRRMEARRKREQPPQTTQQPQEVETQAREPYKPTNQQPQQPLQQPPQRQLSEKVKQRLKRSPVLSQRTTPKRRRIQRRPVKVNPDA